MSTVCDDVKTQSQVCSQFTVHTGHCESKFELSRGVIEVLVMDLVMALDLRDRLPEELWVEVCDIVQEAVMKTIPKKKKCKQAKCLSEEAIQIVDKKGEMKSKGEKERYTHLNAGFQRIARGDKKTS